MTTATAPQTFEEYREDAQRSGLLASLQSRALAPLAGAERTSANAASMAETMLRRMWEERPVREMAVTFQITVRPGDSPEVAPRTVHDRTVTLAERACGGFAEDGARQVLREAAYMADHYVSRLEAPMDELETATARAVFHAEVLTGMARAGAEGGGSVRKETVDSSTYVTRYRVAVCPLD